MEDLSLESIVNRVGTKYTKVMLETALSHDGAVGQCWVLVEGELDYIYYNRVLPGNDAFVVQAGYVAKDGMVRGGFKIVMNLVADLVPQFPNSYIIGIVDRDYTQYYPNEVNFPDDIFVTDHRDLEMTLLAPEHVWTRFVTWLKTESTPEYKFSDPMLAESVQSCRYMGSIRISGAWHGVKTRCEFKASHFWDQEKHAFLPQNQRELNLLKHYQKCALKDAEFDFAQTHLDESNRHFNIENIAFSDLCRGHDWMMILSQVLVRTDLFNEESMSLKLLSFTDVHDFNNTQLHHQLFAWQKPKNVFVVQPIK